MPTPQPADEKPDGGLLSMRTALVLLLALAAAAVTGCLLWVSGRHPAEAWLAALACLAAGIKFFHWLIGSDPDR